jgi:acyl carrier protein
VNLDDIKAAVSSFILREFLPGEKPEALKGNTQLITQGILDSLATLKLVSFIEDKYKIVVEPHEADAEHLNTLDDIADLIASKLRKS